MQLTDGDVMLDAIHAFFGTGDFMPHGMCYLWRPGVLGLHVASDALIAAAYFSIAFALAHFLRRRKDLEFNWMIACFAVFIVACGGTHLMEIVTIWHPIYWFSGAIKALTAATSVPTAVLLVKMMPAALRWPSPRILHDANTELQRANSALLAQAAEQRRMERELQRVNHELQEQLSDMRRLHELSTRLSQATELPKVLDEILAATVALQRADFGHLQLFDNKTLSLQIVAHRGFSQRYLDQFLAVTADGESAAARALRKRGRVIIEDVTQDAAYGPYLEVAEYEGYRAVQSAPIVGRDGQVKGMLTTQFRRPHRPPDSDLQLTDLYMRLASELLERTQNEDSLRMARDEASRANQAKSRFLATASHDLRQPLQSLALLNGTLRRIVTYPIAADALSQQDQAIAAMSRLLNALLDISKLESGAVKPEPADFTLGAIFEELRTEFSSIAASKGLKLEIETCNEAVHSDSSLVEQILRNLLSNAVKYTREGGVRLRCLREAALVRIEIIDTGVGIPADQLPYIYDEFYQVGVAANSSRDGYGLGLSIVRHLAKLLALELTVRSELGKGTTFSLTLPASKGRAAPVHRETTQSTVLRPQHQGDARILLVEDNASVRRATTLLLELEGYHVTPVASLAAALNHVRAGNRVDLLVSDYHLNDGETGSQVIAALRDELGVALPSVLATGDTSAAIKHLPSDPRLRIASKPIRAEELLTLLRELLAD